MKVVWRTQTFRRDTNVEDNNLVLILWCSHGMGMTWSIEPTTCSNLDASAGWCAWSSPYWWDHCTVLMLWGSLTMARDNNATAACQPGNCCAAKLPAGDAYCETSCVRKQLAMTARYNSCIFLSGETLKIFCNRNLKTVCGRYSRSS
jgi:hypothetical protein